MHYPESPKVSEHPFKIKVPNFDIMDRQTRAYTSGQIPEKGLKKFPKPPSLTMASKLGTLLQTQ